MAATAHLSYLLTHQLANDDALASNPLNAESALSLLEGHRLVAGAEREARETSTAAGERAASTLHRWQLRLSSLVSLNPKVSSSSSSSSSSAASTSSAVQAAGFLLVLRSCQQSDPFFFAHSKQWYTSAITLLSRKTPPTGQLSAAATDFLLFCFKRALVSQEYAREVANPAGVRKLGEGLLALAANDGNDAQTRLHALKSLSDLIRISASPLRPLAQQLQIVSVTLLCQWSSGAPFAAGQEAAARLLGSVYITAGKAQAGQGWRRTVESLAGSSHQLISVLASTLVEEYGAPGHLAPLDMPPLPQASNRNAMDQIDALYPALDRLEAITGVLISMLASATERTVPVPLAVLVRLCQRLFSLTIYSPQRERTDASLYQVQATLLPKLHVLGCKLFSQLATSLGDFLTPFSSQVLAQIAFVQGTYPSGSPIRCSFYAVSSVLVSSCPVHPDDGSKSLAKIVRSILEDAAFLVDPDEGRSLPRKEAPTNSKNGQDERKAKRQKMYDTEQGSLNVRRRTDELEVEIVRHGLSSLHHILHSSSWLLPPSQMNVALRVLLAFSLSPHFFLTVSTGVAPSLLSEAISFCPALRPTILSCLVASLHTVARESSGMLDHAMSVFRRGLASSVGAAERSLCEEGLRVIQTSARPVVPPMLRTKAMKRVMRQMAGGDVDRREKEQRNEEASAHQPAPANSGYTFEQPATTRPQQHYPALANHVIQPDVTQPAAPAQEALRPSGLVAEAATLPTGEASPFVESVQPPAPAESAQSVSEVSEAIIEVAATAEDGNTQKQEEEDTAMLDLPEAAPPVPAEKEDGGSSDDSDDDDAPLPTIVMSDDE